MTFEEFCEFHRMLEHRAYIILGFIYDNFNVNEEYIKQILTDTTIESQLTLEMIYDGLVEFKKYNSDKKNRVAFYSLIYMLKDMSNKGFHGAAAGVELRKILLNKGAKMKDKKHLGSNKRLLEVGKKYKAIKEFFTAYCVIVYKGEILYIEETHKGNNKLLSANNEKYLLRKNKSYIDCLELITDENKKCTTGHLLKSITEELKVKEENKALDLLWQSYEKWNQADEVLRDNLGKECDKKMNLALRIGGTVLIKHGTSNCPLCRSFIEEDNCSTCPIRNKVGSPGCAGTPFDNWSEYTTKAISINTLRIHKAMTDFLYDLWIELKEEEKEEEDLKMGDFVVTPWNKSLRLVCREKENSGNLFTVDMCGVTQVVGKENFKRNNYKKISKQEALEMLKKEWS